MAHGPYRIPGDALTPEATSYERTAEALAKRAALMTDGERAAQARADEEQRRYEDAE
jgi:hypothetical protein